MKLTFSSQKVEIAHYKPNISSAAAGNSCMKSSPRPNGNIKLASRPNGNMNVGFKTRRGNVK
jgi:hypothetical protein